MEFYRLFVNIFKIKSEMYLDVKMSHLQIFNPTKKSATSQSETCQGSPLALMMVSSFT